jgi:hypothetical protein
MFMLMEWDWVSELRTPTGPLFIPNLIYKYGESRLNDMAAENRRTRRETCPSATQSTTNPTRADPGANPGLCGESPATYRLSHGMAQLMLLHFGSVAVSQFKNVSCQCNIRWHKPACRISTEIHSQHSSPCTLQPSQTWALKSKRKSCSRVTEHYEILRFRNIFSVQKVNILFVGIRVPLLRLLSGSLM